MSEPPSAPDRAVDVGPSGTPGDRHRVVIVGGGFGGVRAAHALSHLPVDITLIDRTNHHLFQPLLYQVGTGVLSPGQIAPALRSIFRNKPNVRVQLAQAASTSTDRSCTVSRTTASRCPTTP